MIKRNAICMIVIALAADMWFASQACCAPIAYTNYALGTRIGGTEASAIWDGTYTSGPNPFSWYAGPDNQAAPFWRSNTRAYAEYLFTGAPTFDANLVGTIPFVGTYTVQAFDEADPGVILGTMVWSAAGAAPIDFNASRAVVDAVNGLVMLRWGQPYLPSDQAVELHTFVGETGVFANDGILPVALSGSADEELFITGWVLQPLMPNLSLQDNIFAAPFIGATAELVFRGHYIPEPTGIALVLIATAIGTTFPMRFARQIDHHTSR